jgi:hypothetical protein
MSSSALLGSDARGLKELGTEAFLKAYGKYVRRLALRLVWVATRPCGVEAADPRPGALRRPAAARARAGPAGGQGRAAGRDARQARRRGGGPAPPGAAQLP